MPYIVKTEPPTCSEAHERGNAPDGNAPECVICGGTDAPTALAYASMGEVRSAILTELGDRGYIDGPEHELCGAVADLSDASGGTIGPLADGYVIDVQHFTALGFRIHCASAGLAGAGADRMDRLISDYNDQ